MCKDTGAKMQVQRYRCKGTGAKIQVQRYRCKGTGAKIQVQRYRCKDVVQHAENAAARQISQFGSCLAPFVDMRHGDVCQQTRHAVLNIVSVTMQIRNV